MRGSMGFTLLLCSMAADTLIPGHGKPMSRKDFATYQRETRDRSSIPRIASGSDR
jgi:hypothetical protein